MIVAIAGLIGAGKSTLVNSFESKNHYTVFKEPVECNPFLKLYYDDPSRWSYTLQIYYLWERYKQAQEAYFKSLKNEIAVLDSTIYSDMAFALLQKESGYFTDDEFKSYKNMHEIIAKQTAYPDALFFLNISPEDTAKRIKLRSRDCESNIPIKYLEDLNCAYKNVLSKLSKHTDIIYIDATKSVDKVYEEVNSIITDKINNSYDINIKYV